MIKKLMINKFIVKVLSLIGWIIVGGMHGLCWLVNEKPNPPAMLGRIE